MNYIYYIKPYGDNELEKSIESWGDNPRDNIAPYIAGILIDLGEFPISYRIDIIDMLNDLDDNRFYAVADDAHEMSLK